MIENNSFIIDSKSKLTQVILANCITFISNLPADKKWEVSIKPYRLNRSNSQNRYLWAVVYKTIVNNDAGVFFNEQTEKTIASSSLKKDEIIHEFFKSKFLNNINFNGIKITPSTTKLKSHQFAEYVKNIMAFSAEKLGIYIPTPQDMKLADYQKWWEVN